jgi:hypothetical protein
VRVAGFVGLVGLYAAFALFGHVRRTFFIPFTRTTLLLGSFVLEAR